MGSSSYWTWVFAGLFVASGLPLAVVEDAGWRNLCGGFSLIGLGGFALSMVRDAVRSGQIRLHATVIRRARSPRLFWATLALIDAAGLGVLVGAVWALFVKPL
jgi:hypothetical protein